jgi:hypothetical protein
MLYDRIIETISKNKEAKANGEYLGIPYPFPRLNNYLSCIDRGQAIGLLGPTGSGKSRFVRNTFLYNTFKFHMETGYKLKIMFFCMEDSKEMTYNFVLCNYLYEKHGIKISVQELTSKTKELDDYILDALVEAKEYFKSFEDVVVFIDGEDDPDKIYDICKRTAQQLGTEIDYVEEFDGVEVNQTRYESDTHVIAIFDNMSNFASQESSGNEQVAILKFVKDYMRLRLCNYYKWTCVLVLQMDFESERQSFTRNGETIASKLEPSLASIGDSKRSSRSLHLIFSLFAPHRHELPQYPLPSKFNPEYFYDITILGNSFRSLRVIKSNYTETGMRVPLLFDGISETFTELPQPKTPELQKIYDDMRNERLGKMYQTKPNFIKINTDAKRNKSSELFDDE